MTDASVQTQTYMHAAQPVAQYPIEPCAPARKSPAIVNFSTLTRRAGTVQLVQNRTCDRRGRVALGGSVPGGSGGRILFFRAKSSTEIIALDRQGTQQQRPDSPAVTPPGVRVNTRYKNSTKGTSSVYPLSSELTVCADSPYAVSVPSPPHPLPRVDSIARKRPRLFCQKCR